MADPLDYYHPTTDEGVDPADASVGPSSLSANPFREAFGGRGEAVAVPAEFDARLDVAADVPATTAIEAALRRAKIPVFRGRDASATGGGAIELHVRRSDLEAARSVAFDVVARRRRLVDFGPPRRLSEEHP